MAQRLQDILGKLYRPPADGRRQVFALSRSDAERLPELPSIAVISVVAPERPPAKLAGFAHVLRLRFEDVDFLNPELSARAKEKLPHAFTAEHGSAIRKFVETLPRKSQRSSCIAKVATPAHPRLQSHCIDYLGTTRNCRTYRRLILPSFAC